MAPSGAKWSALFPTVQRVASRVILDTTETARAVKVMQIQPYAGGGFAVLAPYHVERQGFLIKHEVDYTSKEMLIPRSEWIEYSADDRVKLSFHPDGFVQFSGENPRRILSGRDEATGEPKGLGLVMQHPLYEPITTGPTFGMVVWGLSDFAAAKPEDYQGGLVFSDRDFHNKDHYLRPWIRAKSRENPYKDPAYNIEAFVLPRRLLSQVQIGRPGESVVRIFHPSYQWRGGQIDLRVVDLPGQPVFLGLMVSRTEHEWASDSGFSLHSPSDMKHALAAVYPAPAFDEPPANTLNWSPSPASG